MNSEWIGEILERDFELVFFSKGAVSFEVLQEMTLKEANSLHAFYLTERNFALNNSDEPENGNSVF